jgi:hypothetical protein
MVVYQKIEGNINNGLTSRRWGEQVVKDNAFVSEFRHLNYDSSKVLINRRVNTLINL